jgi:folate-binding protein YgfZ
MTTPDITDAYYKHKNPGFLLIKGEDRAGFIQRQSTNNMDALGPGCVVTTVLTNAAARILDVLQVFEYGEGVLGSITLPGRGSDTAFFLKRRIFFMDKVIIEDASPQVEVLDLFGLQAPALLESFGLAVPDLESTAVGTVADAPVSVLGLQFNGTRQYRLVFEKESLPAVEQGLEGLGFRKLSDSAYEVMRIENGQPGPENELVETYTPLETNLAAVVSENKGCYTGQEVLARQVTYDKITRRLVGIRLEQPVPPGAEVLVDGNKAGRITSAADSPRLGPIALAVLKRPYHSSGTAVHIEVEENQVAGEVHDLPFTS